MSSVLATHQRPVVRFDINRADHRRWVTEGLTDNRWGRIPVRFCWQRGPQEAVGPLLAYYRRLEANQSGGGIRGDGHCTPAAAWVMSH
jgi:hypothetical protein